MRILTVAICIGIICSSKANLIFSLPNNEGLSVMTIVDASDGISDEVFVAGENIIYKLSANLSQLMNVTVSNDAAVIVRGLSVSNGGQYIVACLTTGSCIGYDVINLTSTSSVPLNEPEAVGANGNDPVVIFPGQTEGFVHTGTAVDFGTPSVYRMSLGRYRVLEGSIMADKTRDYTLIRSGDFNTRIFKAGFIVDNFTYYIVEDDGTEFRILRVCNESTSPNFEALYEVQLTCGGTALFASASVFVSLNTLVLAVRSPDTVSVQSRSGRVCTYNINDINTAMDNGLTDCTSAASNNAIESIRPVWDASIPSTGFDIPMICTSYNMCNLAVSGVLDLEAINGDGLPFPNSPSPLIISETGNQFSEFMSSVIVEVEGELLIFIGTGSGVLLKYILHNQNFSNPERYNTTDITDESIISLQWSLGSDYVYGLTSRQVIAILVEDCQSFRDCTSCTGLGDPLCGWCSIENKCSRRSECSNYNETRRWIQDQSMCIANFAISPNTHPVEVADQQFTITADKLPPPLGDESYYCVFGDLGSSLLEGNLIPGVNFTNLTCNYSFTVEQFSNGSDDTAVVDFSLRSNLTNINFTTIDNGFRFFNCSTHTNCRSCLSSNNLCGWCLYDKKCTSSSNQCRVTDWINTGSSNNGSCPLILGRNITNGVSEYQQPVGVSRNLSLNAINLPDSNENYTYQCVISYNGQTSVLEADYTEANGLVCVPAVDNFTQVEYVDDASVSVLWSGLGVMYFLETDVDPLTVILYNCSALAETCSSCSSVSTLRSLDCGWCHDSADCAVTESCSTDSNFTADSGDTCPAPEITMVNPNSGPYQGGTDVTITGTELGVVFEDIINITIGGSLCIIYNDSYQPGVGFRCNTSSTSVNETFSISNISIPIKRGDSIETAVRNSSFRYAVVSVTGFFPARTPQSGNITINILGNNFNISNSSHARITLAETPCVIINRELLNSTFVQCHAGSRLRRGTGPVVFTIDNAVFESEEDFAYTDDPQVFSVTPNDVIRSGGITVTFSGKDLDVVQTTMVIDIVDIIDNSTTDDMVLETYNSSCTSNPDLTDPGRELRCIFPAIPSDLLDDVINGSLEMRYSLVAASVPGLENLHLVSQFVFVFVDDPIITPFNGSISYQPGSSMTISINGTNLNAVEDSELEITIGDGLCSSIMVHNATVLTCVPPQSGSGTFNVTIYIGENINYTVGQINYQQSEDNGEEDNEDLLYIVIAVAGVIAIIILSFLVILCVVVQRYRKKEKKSEKLFADLQMQLEEMESGLADECKTAFTELQTDLELVYHPSEGTLPFLDFRAFAMRFLFPRDQNHVVLRPLEVPKGVNKDDMVRQLEAFKNLLMNKKFVHTMVKTLESNPQKFGIPDRCNVASYLMVAFQTELDYATEILTLLLGDLIQRSLSTRQNPKLLLRRTESIAEKMLANWLCFLLYPYISDTCGESLYVLVKAIKARLEKGPIDVVTGEAKYSLSDERLLRHSIDPKPVDGFALSPTGEEIPVKMWECDTVTQAKEKILDAIYKNNPVSSRPSITEIDLELATSVEHGVSLRDFDASNEADGEFKKINTLGHFHLHVMSAEAASNPRKLPPKFRLVTRRDDRSPVNVKADMVGTIILNPSALSSATLSIAEDEKIYHLVKPEDNNVEQAGAGGGRQKLIREVFLPRLLATKRILQPFVDDLFKAVFTVPRGKPHPKAIKYLFDFLDWQAAQNGISDPEVLHTWKTNSLPLRFWVNVIKNPEFVFDINKSATVDSCLSTVASAYIDACSTKEYPYSKDAPASKLLYISEVKSYKTTIQQYYQTIQSLPKIGDHEMTTYLREVYQNQQSYFVAESALYELFKYCKKYSEQMIENLEGDGLKSLATNFEKLVDEFQ